MISILKKLYYSNFNSDVTNLLELHTESGALEVADSFAYGFKYGVLIMMEVLRDTEVLDKSH